MAGLFQIQYKRRTFIIPIMLLYSAVSKTFSQIQSVHSDELFTNNINVIRKRLAAIRRNKSIGPDGIPGEVLKLGGEAMIPYLARLLEMTINNATIPSDWKVAIVALSWRPKSSGSKQLQIFRNNHTQRFKLG
jgi:hypothetical protein